MFKAIFLPFKINFTRKILQKYFVSGKPLVDIVSVHSISKDLFQLLSIKIMHQKLKLHFSDNCHYRAKVPIKDNLFKKVRLTWQLPLALIRHSIKKDISFHGKKDYSINNYLGQVKL